MDLAFLLALLTALGFGVYALRAMGERNRWERIALESLNRLTIAVRYGRDFASDSPRARAQRAAKIMHDASFHMAQPPGDPPKPKPKRRK